MEKQQKRKNGKVNFDIRSATICGKTRDLIKQFVDSFDSFVINLMVECAWKRVHWHPMTIEKIQCFNMKWISSKYVNKKKLFEMLIENRKCAKLPKQSTTG